MSGRAPGRRVILLEDDGTFRGLLADGLRHAGYDAVEAGTLAEAEAALVECGGAAVLLADRSVSKDGPSGFHFAGEALARFPALRVIYSSGLQAAVRRRPLGPREAALLKPFAMSQLVGALRDLSG